jgi:hypothetical protein
VAQTRTRANPNATLTRTIRKCVQEHAHFPL